jgi:hypothetical protein
MIRNFVGIYSGILNEVERNYGCFLEGLTFQKSRRMERSNYSRLGICRIEEVPSCK